MRFLKLISNDKYQGIFCSLCWWYTTY